MCQVLSEHICLDILSQFGGGGFLGVMVVLWLRWVVGAGHHLVLWQDWAVVCPVPAFVYNNLRLGFFVLGYAYHIFLRIGGGGFMGLGWLALCAWLLPSGLALIGRRFLPTCLA